MAGRIARTQTALRVADFLAPREGKAHLSEYGWSPGVPIVMTRATESVEDAMGMISIHSRAALVAMLDPATKDLRMLYVSTPQAALKKVRATPPGRTMGGPVRAAWLRINHRIARQVLAPYRRGAYYPVVSRHDERT